MHILSEQYKKYEINPINSIILHVMLLSAY
jgi:hypothetical protein